MISRQINHFGQRGFSLTEVCIVISLIGLTASLCWPTLQRFSRELSVEAAAYALSDELHSVREKAIVIGQQQHPTVAPGPYLSTTHGAPTFFPNGSASPFEVRFGTQGRCAFIVRVHESGAIDVRKG